MPNGDPYDVEAETEMFIAWINKFDNQWSFFSLQAAYEMWLHREGFSLLRGDHTKAVQIILVFLSRCLANPLYRRILTNPPSEPDEYSLLQVTAPEESDERTFWEFLIEANFREEYANWSESQAAED